MSHSKANLLKEIRQDQLFVCEIKTARITECPVSERARLKSCHKFIDPALYDGQYMPLVQLQIFTHCITLVIWLVKLLNQRNQNKLTNLF